MTTSDLLQQIRKNLEKRRLEIAEDMVDGRMADMNAYHKNVGISEGLMQASEVIREMKKPTQQLDLINCQSP
jgi:CRISPR/Cas system-associated endonuclease Cas1